MSEQKNRTDSTGKADIQKDGGPSSLSRKSCETKTPYFSVITPSWNQGAFIGKCLESVVAQGDADYEHLVFDNCSTDGTAQVVNRFPQVCFYSEPDRGQSDAVNKGLRTARGEIICWLNSDDAYPAGVFEKLREAFADPAVEVIFGDVLQVAYDGGGEARAPGRLESRLDFIRWWSSAVKLHQPAIFFRRSVLAKSGFLREDLHYAMDYEFWWRLSESHRFHYLPEILAIQHRQPDSKTIRNWVKFYEERERVFAPFYGLIDNGDRGALIKEKKAVMARNYLQNAYAAVQNDRCGAWHDLIRAWNESPHFVLHPRILGLLCSLILPRRGVVLTNA